MNAFQFSFRLLSSKDLDPYFEMVDRNRKRLEDFFTGTVSRTQTREDTALFLEEIEERIGKKTYFPYLLIDTGTSEIAGFFDIKNIDWSIPKAELGCYMEERSAGLGLASQAFEAFVRLAFDTYGFHKLFLRTHEANKAARRLAEKCGFQKEGLIRSDYRTTSGILVDLIYYGRIN